MEHEQGSAHFISIYGSRGTLYIGWKESKYKTVENQDWVIFGPGYDKVASFANQLKNFAGAIRGTEALIITPEDALASVRVIETAYAALRSEKWHPVQPSGEAGPALRSASATAALN